MKQEKFVNLLHKLVDDTKEHEIATLNQLIKELKLAFTENGLIKD